MNVLSAGSGAFALRHPSQHSWLLARFCSFESIFPPDGGVVKRRRNIRFSQSEAGGPTESRRCCAALCSRALKSLFFVDYYFFNIHGCNEKAARA